MARAAQYPGMTLTQHLDELRSRIVKSVLAILIASGFVWVQYEAVFSFLSKPFDAAHKSHPETILALTGVTSGLVMQLNVALVGGAILASPVWIYQLWRFIAPGLHQNERRIAATFTIFAVPMFLLGCWLGYVVLPHTLEALFAFTPTDVTNVTNVENYISFSLHLTLFFGLGFLIPVLLLALNAFGVLKGQSMLRAWRWLVLGSFFFGAIATPNGDPLGMTLIALPIALLNFMVAGIAILRDRQRARRVSGD